MRRKLTARRRRAFLEALARTGNVSAAAQAVGVSRACAYEHRAADPAFAAAWDAALDEAMDALEAEAWRRAVDGVERPVYQNGQRVGAVREYSDTLLIFLLKGGRPQKYRERYELSGPQSQPLLQPVADALLKVYGTDADDQSPQ